MSSDSAIPLLESINSRRCNVGVIGLGYVGLPLIDAFVNSGFCCTGFDVDPRKVET
ncbi:MAG: nucleotide sugar dehydrogenase, partial [Planctomycetota bacterium]